MIRWYDYIVVFLAADMMAGAIFNAPDFISGSIMGFVVYYMFGVYCEVRKAYEDVDN